MLLGAGVGALTPLLSKKKLYFFQNTAHKLNYCCHYKQLNITNYIL